MSCSGYIFFLSYSSTKKFIRRGKEREECVSCIHKSIIAHVDVIKVTIDAVYDVIYYQRSLNYCFEN